MSNFESIKQVNQPTKDRFKRLSQRDILPSAIKPHQLSQDVLVNTQAEILGPFSINDNASLSVVSIVASSVSEDYILGSNQYNIVFFQTTLAVGSIIGSAVTGNYDINGPMPMPQFTPYAEGTTIGGNNGKNLVFLTELVNRSGGTQTIYAITDTRVFVPTGGGAA